MKYLWFALAASVMVGGCSNVTPNDNEVTADKVMTLNTNTLARPES